jgi:hypothetical protein
MKALTWYVYIVYILYIYCVYIVLPHERKLQFQKIKNKHTCIADYSTLLKNEVVIHLYCTVYVVYILYIVYIYCILYIVLSNEQMLQVQKIKKIHTCMTD